MLAIAVGILWSQIFWDELLNNLFSVKLMKIMKKNSQNTSCTTFDIILLTLALE